MGIEPAIFQLQASTLTNMPLVHHHIPFTIIFLSIGIQIDRLDVTNEEDVKGIIKTYSTQSDTTKNINTVFNCAG